MKPRTAFYYSRRNPLPDDKFAAVPTTDLRKPWLLHTRKPKNRGNAGAGMKAKEFLKRVDSLFPGGAK